LTIVETNISEAQVAVVVSDIRRKRQGRAFRGRNRSSYCPRRGLVLDAEGVGRRATEM